MPPRAARVVILADDVAELLQGLRLADDVPGPSHVEREDAGLPVLELPQVAPEAVRRLRLLRVVAPVVGHHVADGPLEADRGHGDQLGRAQRRPPALTQGVVDLGAAFLVVLPIQGHVGDAVPRLF